MDLRYFFTTLTMGIALCFPGFFACKSPAQGTPQPVFAPPYDISGKSFQEAIAILEQHEHNTDPNIQRRVYFDYYLLGTQTIFDNERRWIVKKLLCACGDSLEQGYACQSAMEYLQSWPKSDFDSTDLKRVAYLVQRDYSAYFPQPEQYLPYNDLVLLAGFLDLYETEPFLQRLVAPESPYQRKWEAHLALARMGDTTSIQYCLASFRARDLGVPDLVEISYIRQPEIIELYNSWLFSEERLPPLTPGETGPLKSSYILRFYCKTLLNFPITSKGIGYYDKYTPEEIETARTWVRAHKGQYRMEREGFEM